MSLDAHFEDLFAPLGGVSVRRMFGGRGIFREGLMFALAHDDTLYLKVDETTRPAFEAESSEPFAPEMGGKKTEMGYRRLPEQLYDEPEAFVEWAQAAFEVAVRADEAKPGSKRKRRP